MTIDMVKEISAEAFKAMMLASAPALLVSLVVGLFVSLVQAVTQIQEFTLTFVPKIVAVFICLFLLLPWIAGVLIAFTVRIMDRIPMVLR